MKKGWSILLVIFFIFLLSGCGCTKKTYTTTNTNPTTENTTKDDPTPDPGVDGKYILTLQNANPNMGSFNDVSGEYDNGTSISLLATPNVGVDFDGWYDGSTCISTNSSFSYTMPAKKTILTCKFKEKAELNGYNYISTATECILTSVKDKTQTSITIPDCVTKMEEGCLSGCSSLVELTIPYTGSEKGKTKDDLHQYPLGYLFGEEEFVGSTQISQSFYDDDLNTITSKNFYIPDSLKKVIVEGGSILRGTFNECSNIDEITFLEDVTRIEGYALIHTGVTSLMLEDSIIYLDENAFQGCSNLKSVRLPNTITKIPYRMFSGCSSLEDVYIPEMVSEFDEYAFIYNQNTLKNVYYEGTIASWLNMIFPSYFANPAYFANHFYMKTNGAFKEVTSINIPYGITKIKPYTCSFKNVIQITIPESVTEIGSRSFLYCKALQSINIPASVKMFGEAIFLGCTSLKEMTIAFPNSGTNLTDILGRNFTGADQCNPKTLTVVGETIYENSLEGLNADCNIVISKSVKNINGQFNCNSIYYDGNIADLCLINFANSYSNPLAYDSCTINDNTFTDDIRNLPVFEVPSNVTTIKKYALTSLNAAKIIIPNTVKTLETSSISSGYLIEVINYSDIVIDAGNTYGLYANYYYTNENHPDTLVFANDCAFGYN